MTNGSTGEGTGGGQGGGGGTGGGSPMPPRRSCRSRGAGGFLGALIGSMI
jgi:hypothetical protein